MWYAAKVNTTFGEIMTVGVPARYSRTPPDSVGISPDLGEHTNGVLREVDAMVILSFKPSWGLSQWGLTE